MEKKHIEGTADDLKGRVKEAAGDLTDNDRLRGEGTLDRLKGEAKKIAGDISEKVKEGIGKAEHPHSGR
jgi:uncharacterized protein YjbJ (UPF0337 family)